MQLHEFLPGGKNNDPPLVAAEFIYRSGVHEQYEWKPTPWKGIQKKVLFFDPFSGVTFDLIRMAAGITFPEHYVTATQTSYLLQGRIRREDGALIHPASFLFVPAGEVQIPVKSESESIALRYFGGVPVYVLSDGSTFITKSDGKIVLAGRINFVGGAHPKNIVAP